MKVRNKSYYFSILCILFLPACGSKKKKIVKPSAVYEVGNDFIDRLRQYEALLIDVPIPLYTKRLLINTDQFDSEQSGHVFGYQTDLERNEIINFYTQQMEHFGWQMICVFEGNEESLLHFQTPRRICTVSIRCNGKGKSDLVLFVGEKIEKYS